MKRCISLLLLCWSVLLCAEVQAQQAPPNPEYRRTPAELHQLRQQAKAERRAQRQEKAAWKQANATQHTQAKQIREQAYQMRQQQKQQQSSAQEAALVQRRQAKQIQRQRKQMHLQKKQYQQSLQKQQHIAKKREKNLQHHNKRLRKKQKQNQHQANRTLATNRRQIQSLEKQQTKTQQATNRTRKMMKMASRAVPGAGFVQGQENHTARSGKAAYMGKLLQISPRIQYGVGSFRSTMTYETPDLSLSLGSTINDLKIKYPWVPWKSVSITPKEGIRTRTQVQSGKFFGTVGLNLPFVFLDIEAGAGRFTQPTLLLGDLWPPGDLFRLDQLTSLMIDRIQQTKPKQSVNLRVGIEGERLIPDPWLPRMEFGRSAIGIDASIYFLLGVDLSYRPGAELLGENAEQDLIDAFSSVPFVSDAVKQQTAQAILRTVEENLPVYTWLPAMKGMGLSGRAYLDLGRHTRMVVQYHHEATRGLGINNGEWLQQGPSVKRSFLTFGITTQL